MNEIERTAFTKKVTQERNKQLKLKEKLTRIEELLKIDAVREFYELESEIANISTIESRRIPLVTMEQYRSTLYCTHEYYCGVNCAVTEDGVPYFSSNPDDNVYIGYFCLDCNSNGIFKSWWNAPDFEAKHKCLNIIGLDISLDDIRMRYLELLNSNSSEEAYQILKSELESLKEEKKNSKA